MTPFGHLTRADDRTASPPGRPACRRHRRLMDTAVELGRARSQGTRTAGPVGCDTDCDRPDRGIHRGEQRASAGEFTLQQRDELGVEVDVLVFTTRWDGDIGPVKEDPQVIGGSFEQGMPFGGRQRNADNLRATAPTRPYPDISVASRLPQALAEQIPREHPLHGLVLAGVEGRVHSMRVVAVVSH